MGKIKYIVKDAICSNHGNKFISIILIFIYVISSCSCCIIPFFNKASEVEIDTYYSVSDKNQLFMSPSTDKQVSLVEKEVSEYKDEIKLSNESYYCTDIILNHNGSNTCYLLNNQSQMKFQGSYSLFKDDFSGLVISESYAEKLFPGVSNEAIIGKKVNFSYFFVGDSKATSLEDVTISDIFTERVFPKSFIPITNHQLSIQDNFCFMSLDAYFSTNKETFESRGLKYYKNYDLIFKSDLSSQETVKILSDCQFDYSVPDRGFSSYYTDTLSAKNSMKSINELGMAVSISLCVISFLSIVYLTVLQRKKDENSMRIRWLFGASENEIFELSLFEGILKEFVAYLISVVILFITGYIFLSYYNLLFISPFLISLEILSIFYAVLIFITVFICFISRRSFFDKSQRR